MRAGELKERISIYRLIKKTDMYGGDISDYQLYTNTFANIYTSKQDRTIINYGELFPSLATIITRYHHNILDTDRIQFANEMYRILSVNRLRDRQLIEIKVEKIKD